MLAGVADCPAHDSPPRVNAYTLCATSHADITDHHEHALHHTSRMTEESRE